MANLGISRVVIDLFVEDRAHEEFLRALLRRIAEEEGVRITIRLRSGRGGHGRALSEFVLFQRVLLSQPEPPDIIVVCIDGNCQGLVRARNEISRHVEVSLRSRVVIACPNPHIERWYLADPASFEHVVGSRPRLEARKCERGLYKSRLIQAVQDGGHPTTLGGIEFAQEIVDSMDLYRAGKNERSFHHFVEGARAMIRSLR